MWGVCAHVNPHVCVCVCARVALSSPSSHRAPACLNGQVQVHLAHPSPPLPLCRFRGCKVFPGACTMVPCMRCRPHRNMPLLPLLPSPRLPSTSPRPSETSTSPTSVYQVRAPHAHSSSEGLPRALDEKARSRWGAPSPLFLGGAEQAGGGQRAEGLHRGYTETLDPGYEVCTKIGPELMLKRAFPAKLNVVPGPSDTRDTAVS